MTNTKLRIGMFGGGVVGGGVYLLLQRHRDRLLNQYKVEMEIVKICVKDLAKERDFLASVPEEAARLLTGRYEDILDDDSINCVVEVMGGIVEAKDVMMTAIAKGKHVVTANKALIGHAMVELQQLLSNHPEVQFACEAAVCGGIPIIHSLQTDFVCDNVTKVMGIMNGTTNFMLSKMEDEGADYSDVLTEAQRLGFAEADPTADVEGFDVQAKIAILAKIAFGRTVSLSHIPTKGISSIGKVDFDFVRQNLQSTIKLLGTAIRMPAGEGEENDKVAVFVSPTVVPYSSPLSSAKGPGNMVVVQSQNMVSSTFAGPGAGRFPTANSVMNDLIRVAQGKSLQTFPIQDETLAIDSDFMSRFYIRISSENRVGIIRLVGEEAEKHDISIHSILQKPAPLVGGNVAKSNVVDFAVITDMLPLSKVKAFTSAISGLSFVQGEPLFMPMI